MKLTTLNIWSGQLHDPLLEFIHRHREVDIFCFQEVYHHAPHKISTDDLPVYLNIFDEIQAQLPDHIGFFRPTVKGIYGLALFVKQSIDVLAEGEVLIHENKDYPGAGPTHSRILQFVECRANGKIYSILNVHGLWNGMGKTDTVARLAQSERIRDFMNTIQTRKILCGDFNLRPDTESLQMLKPGLRDLIEEYGVQSTRTAFYTKPEKFADYVFTSSDITVHHFEALPDAVSDHAALLLDFD